MHANFNVEGVPIGVAQPDVILPSKHSAPRQTRTLEPLKEAAMAAGKLQGGWRDRARGMAITRGIAHVSFPGGSMFLPARNPYDRQMLIEHIVDRARAKERVQVLVDDLRWIVHLRRSPATAHCSACGCALNSACYSTAEQGGAYCLGCAFADHLAQLQPKQEPQRRSF